MTSRIRSLVHTIYDTHLTLGPGRAMARARSTRTDRHVVILTPSSVGNLGDEAMVTSVVAQLRAVDPTMRITLITHRSDDTVHHAHFNVETTCLQGYFDRFAARAACDTLGRVFADATDFILLGADIIDGRYSETRSFRRLYMACKAQEAGLRVFVLGFSFSDQATPRINRYIRGHCAGFTYVCRDPLSARRVSALVGRDVVGGADLAFLVPSPPTTATPEAATAHGVIDSWRAVGRGVLVVNANPLGLMTAFPDVDLADAARAYAEGLSQVAASSGAGLLLLTHDNRPGPHSDAAFMTAIDAQLAPDVTRHFVPETLRATDIKFLCGQADMSVTGRMHLGIASLGSGTATMILDFQGKVQGLFALFEQPDMALDVRDVLVAETFAARVTDAYARHSEISGQVRERLDAVHDLSARNIAAVRAAWSHGSAGSD